MIPAEQTLTRDRYGRPVLRTTWTQPCGAKVVHDRPLAQPIRARHAAALVAGVSGALLAVVLAFATPALSGGTLAAVVLLLLAAATVYRTLHRLGRIR